MKIICTERDYADEFDYPILSIITDEIEVKFRERMEELKKFGVSFSDQREYYFGTNEALDLSYDEIINMVDNAKPITDAELEVLVKFNVITLGIDIVKRVISKEDFDDLEDENY